ncbi:hypothetical protein NZ698_06330 [Chryseobacterium sp. PBS4-4]|uniref:Uncharacterized protein n=1 Tax=Chryseobacterium edaphi TaxID=2976532 RepID=A0ABT2W3M7_9FLAO|nr:hypothetical protein [Chryseobacterium edaphi]MCU7616809.1 hypothetical protein [Chryseobacterium edaphi]
MENPITEAKKELIQWIKDMEELEDIAELMKIKSRMTSDGKVAEQQPQYVVEDDFDARFAKGISHTEMRRRTIEHVRNLPWK